MKSILRKWLFYIKELILITIGMFGLIFVIFALDTYTKLPIGLTIFIGVLFLLILVCLYFVIVGNFKKPFCKVPATAKIIDSIPLLRTYDEVCYGYDYYSLVTLEYKYKNKMYRKSILCDLQARKINSRVNIMICKGFPKIIYMIEEK